LYTREERSRLALTSTVSRQSMGFSSDTSSDRLRESLREMERFVEI
jgi:hypothetical protein